MPVKAIPNIIGETEFGFTLGSLKTFDEVVRDTLRRNADKIAENLSANNAFLLRIKNNDYVKINYIDPAVQTQRIIANSDTQATKKHKDRWGSESEVYKYREQVRMHAPVNNIFYEGHENIGELIHREAKEKLT